MISISIEQLFDKYDAEYNKFDRIEYKFNVRPIMHALVILVKLIPVDYSIINTVLDNNIYFHTNEVSLLKVITEDQVRDLCRCGVYYDTYDNSLVMNL